MKKKQIQLCVLYLEAVWKMVHMWGQKTPKKRKQRRQLQQGEALYARECGGEQTEEQRDGN